MLLVTNVTIAAFYILLGYHVVHTAYLICYSRSPKYASQIKIRIGMKFQLLAAIQCTKIDQIVWLPTTVYANYFCFKFLQ